MLRNRAVALILCWLASPLAYCLGLGPLEASSGLNEPFKGRIQILGAKAEDFDTLTVGLAGEEQFDRAGIERHPALFQLRFTLDDSSPGKDYIAISSRDPVREPFLNFLLEMNWPNGRLMREYTVLLDPPLYDPQRHAPAPRAAAPAVSARSPYPVPAAAPSSVAARPASVASAPAPVSRLTAGQEIGPVQANDTLWSIATAYRPDASVSVQQMMLALLRANPDAFSEGNINMMRRGAVLRVPDAATLNAVEANEAYAEVRRQHQVWEEYRQQIGSAPAPQPMGAAPPPETAEASTATPATERAADARLELVAPGGTEGGGKPGGAAASGSGSGELASEAADSKAQEATDLQDKLKEAEEIIDLLQRQVNIKDEELAALQARLAELGVDTAAPAAGTATTAETATPADATPAAETPATETPAAADETPVAEESASPADETLTETPAAADVPATDETVADESVDDAEIDESAASAEAEAPPDAATDSDEIDVDNGATSSVPADAPGFPANLVPAAIAALVPGGALTVLGIVLALLVLGLFVVVAQFLIKSRGEDGTPIVKPIAKTPPRAPAADEVTQTSPTAVGDSEAITQFGVDTVTEVPAFDPLATVEATADATTQVGGMPSAEQGDPLEEVNVYLAYERFDQAEELVKRVIGQYPGRHDYKLRLLEVYYSSNDRPAYEAAARDLLDAVGESDPLWSSAVAMWAEMSPERALFAEGAIADVAPAQDSAKAFVDITGDTDDEPGESTLAHAPGGHDRESETELDFNLGDASQGGGDILDLTSTADGSDIFDLTKSSADSADTDSDVFDITVGDTDSVLDISGGGSAADSAVLDLTDDDGGLLDITGGDDILDITGLENQVASGVDLLDVTKTGDISSFEDHDLLNVTSPGLRAVEPTEASIHGSDTSELTAFEVAELGHATGLDFDISDTVAPVFGADDSSDDDEDVILDITSGGMGTDEDVLDFDIGGLDVAGAGTTTAVDPDQVATITLDAPATGGTLGGDLDLDLELEDETGSGSDLDFDITMGSEDLDLGLGLGDSEKDDALEISLGPVVESPVGELSLQGSALDDLVQDSAAEANGDDFDFSLDGTTEMDGIAADETIDMASVVASNREILDLGDDASLEDLTIELDNALGVSGLDTVELDLGDDELLTTLSLDVEGEDTLIGAGDTVVMPRVGSNNPNDDNDDADTKLNLAKAYIELGDTDGARSILEEVVRDGAESQKAEARVLLGQLGG